MRRIDRQNKICRFYFRWPTDGDKWFFWSKSWSGAYRYLRSDETVIDFYGYHLGIGPLQFVFCKPMELE